MEALKIHLFGKLTIHCDEQIIKTFKSQKQKELICYLLIYRNQSHHRDVLADRLWGHLKIENPRSYLRKALWELQISLNSLSGCLERDMLIVEPEWLNVDIQKLCWLDVAMFENAYTQVRRLRGKELSEGQFLDLRRAVDLYKGDLLEGWYQNWCVFERLRFKEMYLAIVGKLMGYCETHHDYQSGIDYGIELLRHDIAHERTHRRLMRLHYLAGDRTAAIRQYNRCKEALMEELSVNPSERTHQLHQQIVSGTRGIYGQSPRRELNQIGDPVHPLVHVVALLGRIKQRLTTQVDENRRLLLEVESLEDSLKDNL